MPAMISNVTPDLLHKSHQDDVLIKDPNWVLPSYLDRHLLDDRTAQFLSSSPLYEFDETKDRFRLLNASYEADDGGPLFSPSFFESLYFGGNDTNANVDSEEVARVVETLTQEPIHLAPAISGTVLNDTKNYFFYRKEHEHVPGLMFLEVARQCVYYYVYTVYPWSRGDVSISMLKIDGDFQQYGESCYPIDFIVHQADRNLVACPKSYDLLIHFYQRGSLISTVRMHGGIMKLPLFSRLRKFAVPGTHYFKPSERVDPSVLLDLRSGNSLKVDLKALSLKSLLVEAADSLPVDDIIRGTFYAKGFGCVPLPVSGASNISENLIRIDLQALSGDTDMALREILKRHCFFEGDATEVEHRFHN